LTIVANSHGHQCLAIAEKVVDHGSPGMHVRVIDWEVRPKTQIDELILPRQQHFLD